MKELLQKLTSATERAIHESEEIDEAMHEINEAGFIVSGFILATELAIIRNSEPEVEGEKIKPQIEFTSGDRKFAQSAHIKLEDEENN